MGRGVKEWGEEEFWRGGWDCRGEIREIKGMQRKKNGNEREELGETYYIIIRGKQRCGTEGRTLGRY